VRFTLTGSGAFSTSEDGKMLIKNNTELAAYPSAGGDITLPGITSIGYSAFYGCTSLTSVSFPAAASIGSHAFYGCTSLASVSFPAAASIGSSAFYGCTGLTSITLGATRPSPGTEIFGSITACTVTVRIPASAKAAYDVPNLPGTNFNNSDTTSNNWGNAFRGKGWNGTNYQSGTVNTNITLVFETY
jgi:hypothetical protein